MRRKEERVRSLEGMEEVHAEELNISSGGEGVWVSGG